MGNSVLQFKNHCIKISHAGHKDSRKRQILILLNRLRLSPPGSTLPGFNSGTSQVKEKEGVWVCTHGITLPFEEVQNMGTSPDQLLNEDRSLGSMTSD